MLLNKRISLRYFIDQIKSQILLIVILAVSTSLLDLHPVFTKITIPLSIPAILGTAVSLLLAFRTAQSYERWWEARTVWGAIVNDSRSFIRLINQFVPQNSEDIKIFAERQIVWVYALGEALRRQPFSNKVVEYLHKHQINAVNIPNAILDEHSHQIRRIAEKGLISDFKEVQLNEVLMRLCDNMGKCERLKNTVFPRAYSILIHTLIYVFAFILPFGLEDSLLTLEIITTIIIPLIFIAIEKTAIIMQDPFENTPVDTPMTSIAQTIEINILQMIKEKDIPVKKENNTYFEM
ncbi:putative membrane protein [Chryseobacterium sp. SLBN-27]|jgi:ion channel-forming bestrophin family protein|uniref:bestrophin family protein n=1 Tax=Chryseobacterium sp. SLBN-27 TaxID=3042287 RepID=UPI0028558D26|nr:bestrophin family ion channel [Chryseobacterium sp. SLBN-27]MDR6156683.1 putative membrane protein [Chryseobacterium sp. SLBN-27]